MPTPLLFCANDTSLSPEEFIRLFKWRQPNEVLNPTIVAEILSKSIVATARRDGELVGCIRVLSDEYIFGAIAEMMTLPTMYVDRELWKGLLNAAVESCPTRLSVASNRMDPKFMLQLGWEAGVMSYVHCAKPRVAKR